MDVTLDLTLLSGGDCPLCSSLGPVLIVRSAKSGELLFMCPMCGLAWTKQPSSIPGEVDDQAILLGDLAPDGVEFPSLGEVESLSIPNLKPVEYSFWRSRFEPFGWISTQQLEKIVKK